MGERRKKAGENIALGPRTPLGHLNQRRRRARERRSGGKEGSMVISYRYSIALPSKEKLAILKKKKSSFGQEFCMASTGKYDSVVKTV